ncbi:hypothetical protein LWI28_004997 [Acer negundo]|uniref:PGG domain-containing protein n=1 Tax=Acer negundo TaxID=4023 RepID=A0AAD5JFW6_ACENE|nr:hypothetical protein LWI28_004997 [Acer negundo]
MFNFSSKLKAPYQAVMEGKWDYLNDFNNSYPMTVANDNAFHIAVHSKSDEPLKHLLESERCRVDYEHVCARVLKTNAYENTVLHEAAINHNIAAVKLLVEGDYVTPEQLLEQNKSGQTPLFKAAAFGSTKVVKFLASRPNQMTYNKKQLRDNHRTNNDKTSILHAAVRGEHFGTALALLKLDEGLAELKNKNGMTSLHLLTNLQSAFSNKFGIHLWHRLLYFCIPTGNDNYDDADIIDEDEYDDKVANKITIEVDDEYDDKVGDNQNKNAPSQLTLIIFLVLEPIKKSFWKYFIRDGRWPTVRKIWKEKRKRNFAFKLARELIKNDDSWQQSYTDDTTQYFRSLRIDEPKEMRVEMIEFENESTDNRSLPNDAPKEMRVEMIEFENESTYNRSLLNDEEMPVEMVEKDIDDKEDKSETAEDNKPAPTAGVIELVKEITIEDKHQVETPLLAATRTGVIELVKEIVKMHPQAVEHISHNKQNILHVAASYRQREVFELVKKMQITTSRLILGIDTESYTVLHHVADTRNYTGGTRPGPAYNLQAELEWFQRVEEIMPSYFTQHHDKNNKTAKELFKEKHAIQLKEAQQWIKETSQSCSGVAVLVATVVFAAAFTVPGGNNDENGLPILLHTPFFMFFTVMDVVSLSCSLTAVVMFLSIITSPFELDNFRILLPRRLTLGFALLFMSVATTMLAFTSTIFLIIRSEQRRQWTLTLICSAAFVPVSVLALTHFPLFVSFIRAWNNFFKLIGMAIPYNLLLQILTFLGKLVYPLGLFIKELGLCFLKFLHKLVVRFGLYIKELGIGFLELGIYIKKLGLRFLKFLHKLVHRLGSQFLKFLHYIVR